MKISVIVPVYNEEQLIIPSLKTLLSDIQDHEVIVVDGNSTDQTFTLASELATAYPQVMVTRDKAISGRAKQMNHGANCAEGEVLLFLHIDCRLGPRALEVINRTLHNRAIIGGGFYKKYDSENVMLWLHRAIMNLVRTKMLKNLVGTNAIFVRRDVFRELGGYDDVPIMEEVILWDRIKATGPVKFLKPHVICSSRKYYGDGIFKRIVLAARVLYLFRIKKVSIAELKTLYTKS